MFESGIAPSTIDREDYMEVLTIMKARPREERPMNAEDAHKKMARLLSK